MEGDLGKGKRKSVVEVVREKWAQLSEPKRPKKTDELEFISLVEDGDEQAQLVINAASTSLSSSTRSPWMAEGRNEYVSLEQELQEFSKWVQPTPRERQVREESINRLRWLVGQTWNSRDASCHVFGSYSLDLCLPGSDVDFVILGYAARGFKPLRKLAGTIRNKQFASAMTLIEHSRVPIIKYTDAVTNVECDVSCDMESGMLTSDCFNDILNHKSMALARPLVFIVKYWLRSQGLHEPFRGGLGSYSVLIMVISMLQHNRNPQLTLANATRKFFRFYGCEFNWITTGISLLHGGSYFRKENRGSTDFCDDKEKWRPALEDPTDPTNNIGRASFAMPKIREAMADASFVLEQPIPKQGAYFVICSPDANSARL